MEVLDAASRRAGNLRISRYIEERFPGILGDRVEEERIAVSEKYRKLAAGFGFVNDDHIGYFMDLCVMFGTSFPSERAFSWIMQDDTLTADSKLLHLRAVLALEGVEL